MGLNTTNLLSNRLLCCEPNSSPAQTQWPRRGPLAALAVSGWEADPTRCHLPTGKHRALLFPLGNRWKPAKPCPQGETSIRSGSCLLCAVFRGCKHRSIKEKTTMVLCEPLSACATFWFSSLACIARKILKWILCTDLLSLFLCFFFSPAFKYGLLCSIKMHVLLRTSRWSVSQTRS